MRGNGITEMTASSLTRGRTLWLVTAHPDAWKRRAAEHLLWL